MPLEPHLFFQVREDALDRQPQPCEDAFALVVGGGSLACRRQQLYLGAGHPLVVGASPEALVADHRLAGIDRKSTRLNSSHITISYAVFCLKKKKKKKNKKHIKKQKKKQKYK